MLVIDDVTISFGKNTVIKNLTLDFPESKIYCIVGPSGCGKSTLIRAIAGFQKVTSGKIFFDDKKVDRPLRDICMLHQSYINFPWLNCLDNVLMPVSSNRKVTKKDIEEAIQILEKMGLADSLKKLPHEMSGGMNQRLALSRIMMQKPKLLLMDEPLSALDQKTRTEIQRYIMDFDTPYNTIIIITHDEEEAKRLAQNRIIRLQKYQEGSYGI